MSDNPLSVIFKLKNKTDLQDEIQSIVNIKNFFNFISNGKIQEKSKIKVFQKLLSILKTNRYIYEYFSFYDNKSIYIYLFDLFLDPKSTQNFKNTILDFMKELLLNVETNKSVYEYLFQKLSLFYHNENTNDPEMFSNILILFKTIICPGGVIQDPHDYYSFSGNGKLSLDLSNENQKLFVGYRMSFILNFKIGNSSFYENEENSRVSNLINLKFSNGSKILIDLQYPGFLMIKEEKEKMIKVLPINELINLVISIVVDNSDTLQLFYFVNGENNLISYKFKNSLKRVQDYLETVEFFNNFYGEVISITMIRQENESAAGSSTSKYLTIFKNFKEGIWKKKILNKFLDFLNSVNSNQAPTLTEQLLSTDPENKKKYKNNDKVLPPKLKESILFIFTPFNYYKNCGIIDDYFGKYKLIIINNKAGFIRNHRFQFYQKKLNSVCEIGNFLPIAEMFLFRNQLLNEENIVLYLNIIENIIKDKKSNMFSIQECQFFKILCIIFEKLPNNFFTEKVLDSLIQIGKIMLTSEFENLNKQYFTHILLNERIISKFSENLQIKFWNQVLLFCQSDSTQMQSFINMNRICLIIRSYDKNKYSEMCCENHLKVFLDECNDSKKIMEPNMSKKLSYIGGILEYLINTQESSWVLSLFKLLTLDLSPCLSKFIINIVNKALYNQNLEERPIKELWFKGFIKQLISAKYDVILINTFTHSLLDVRIEILKFLYQLNLIFLEFKNIDEVTKWKNILKKILLPQKMFYYTNENKNEVLVFKEYYYKDYIEKILCFILLWSVEQYFIADDAISYLNPKKFEAKKFFNVDILEVAFDLLSQLNYENELCTKFISVLNSIIKNNIGNSCEFLYNKNVFMSALDLVYNTFLGKINDNINDKVNQVKSGFIFNSGKTFISTLFLNTVSFLEFNLEGRYPMSLMENIFTWQDKIVMSNNDENKSEEIKNNISSFISEILGTLLQDYYLKFYIKMRQKENELKNINENFQLYYYQYNYFLLINKIFAFCFECQFNDLILQNKISLLENNIYDLYLLSMRKDNNEKNTTISQIWKEFNFFQLIYDKVKYIFQRRNYSGELEKKLSLKNKIWRYQDMIQKLLLKKEKKNFFKKQICFLCYHDNYIVNFDNIEDKNSYINSSLIKYIELSLMGIITISIEKKLENDFVIWLKHFSHLMKFTILASANLWIGEKPDEKDILFTEKTLKIIQNQCALIIYNGFSFLTRIYKKSPVYTDKIQKTIISIFTLSFVILNYQYNYNRDHKINSRSSFKSRNPYDSLYNSAIFILFEEYLGKNKDTKNKKYFLSTDAINNLINEDDYVNNILTFIKDPKWDEIFLENEEMNEILSAQLCRIPEYKAFVQQKYEITKTNIENSKSDLLSNSNENILKLLPLYEKELKQYSNNSLEQNIQKKNIYKILKKKMFSWNGFWSERNLFYPSENDENTHRLKYKLINHYTKSLMKPILVPILDISYYLPDFSGFNPDNIFNTKNKIIVNMDIDKINIATESNKEISDNITNNYLRTVYIKSNDELAQKLLKIANSLDFGKEEEFSILENNKEDDNSINKKKCYLSCLVKTSHHIKGVCFVDDKNINFKVFLNQKTGNAMSGVNIGFTDKDDDYDPERKTCFGSYFMFHHKDKDLYNIIIKYDEIKWLLKRRYYYKNSGIEIFTVTNKSYYFNFKFEEDRESFINGILEKIKNLKIILNDLKEGKDNILGYENTSLIKKKFKKRDSEKIKEKQKVIKVSKRVKSWIEWKTNNFKFLMFLNILGNRSYNDISQYPIFPWTLSSYTDPLKFDLENSDTTFTSIRKSLKLISSITSKKTDIEPNLNYYRDMKLPMGMLEINEESKKRKEGYLELYDIMKDSPDEFEGTKPYFYGTNYSNPVYVCNYLIRLFPFTHISIELQGNKLDDANRLFLSVEKSFYCSTTQKTDLRELIPEFFYLPEMFININDLNLGKEENGNIVNDVLTPCNNNPYTFIENMKRVFESINISYNLNNWIDLIFGFKIKGKEAENAKNIYTEASYQENVNLNNIEDKGAYLRYVEFGLIPEQVMDKECVKRRRKIDITRGKEITEYTIRNSHKLKINNVKHDNSIDKNCKFFDKQFQKFTVLKSAILNQNKIITLLNNNYLIETEIGYLGENLLNYIKIPEIDNKINEFTTKDINNKLIQFYGAGDFVILGGYYDGKLIIINKNNKKLLELHPFNEEKPIISTAIDENEEFLVVGNTLGNIAVYKLKIELDEWTVLKLITTQNNSVSDINVSSNLNLFATASLDGIINVYTLPLCKLVKSIKINCQKCNNIFLSESTLPSIIIIAEVKDSSDKILSYSINGKLINEYTENQIFSPIVFSDRNSYEYLAYLTDGFLTVINLPSLSTQFVIDKVPSLSTILIDEDKKCIFGFNEDGTQIVAIRD